MSVGIPDEKYERRCDRHTNCHEDSLADPAAGVSHPLRSHFPPFRLSGSVLSLRWRQRVVPDAHGRDHVLVRHVDPVGERDS